MTADLLTRLNTARSLLAELRLARSNPNHVPSGPHGGEFAAGKGGGKAAGKHHARNVRRRKRKLEQLRREGHKEIAEYRDQHRKDRRELVRDQAKEWKAKRREHLKERNALRREHRRDKTEKADRRDAHKAMRQDHAHERQSLHEDHVTDRLDMRADQRADRREVVDRLKADLHDEVPGRSRSGRTREETRSAPDQSTDPALDLVRPVPDFRLPIADFGFDRGNPKSAIQNPQFGRRATHKASTAEAILSHCLRRRGWTGRFAAGRLSGKQHLVLTEDVRQYGRAWLRHEAEQLFAGYGIERSLAGRVAAAINRYFDRTRNFVRELMLAASEALKGQALSSIEVELIELRARVQAQFLKRFEEQVLDNPPAVLVEPNPFATTVETAAVPPMSAAQFTARAELYANAAHQTAQKVNRIGVTGPGGVRMERRKMSPGHDHCPDCPPISHMGWQPVGTLPDIGDSECNGHCCCYFEYMLTPGGLPAVNGKITAVVPNKRPGRLRKPRIVIDVPGLDPNHPPGPLSPAELQAIIGSLKWSATVVLGNR